MSFLLRLSVFVAALASAPTLAQTDAPSGETEPPRATVRVNGVDVPVDFAVPRAPAEIRRIGDAEFAFGVISWAPADDTPDGARRTALFELTSPPRLLTSWVATSDQDLRLVDLDGDGERELVRDITGPTVCGTTQWREPAVYDAATGAFRPVRLRPLPAVESLNGLPRSPGLASDGSSLAQASSRPLDASSGALDAGALVDGDPRTDWTAFAPGESQWLAIQAPVDGRSAALRISTSEADAPLRVIVETGARRFETTVDGLLREIPLQPDESCLVLTVSDLGGRPFASLSEAQIVLDVDRLSADERATDVWVPTVADACASGDALRAQRISALAGANAAFVDAFVGSTDPCEHRALLAGIEASDAPVEAALRLAQHPAATTPLLDVLLPSLSVPEAAPALIQTLANAPEGSAPGALGEALLRSARERSEPIDITSLVVRATSEPEGAWDSLVRDLAPHGVIDLPEAWAASERIDDHRRILHWTALTPVPSESTDAERQTLSEALAHDDGSVARLAIHVAGRRGHTSLAPALWALATGDPIGHVRAEAVRALDALGALDAGGVATLLRDDDPTVRLALASTRAAQRWATADPSGLDLPLSDAWAEVARAWAGQAIAWGDPVVDLAVVASLADADTEQVGSALRAWLARGTAIPDAAVALGRAAGADPATLTWTLAVSPLSDAGCDTAWMETLLADDALPLEAEDAIAATLQRCGSETAP